jgi:midasin
LEEHVNRRIPELQTTATEIRIGSAGLRQVALEIGGRGDNEEESDESEEEEQEEQEGNTNWQQQAIGGATPPSKLKKRAKFAHTGHALRLMEAVAACLARLEPVLLVGETGCGKTSVIQHLASLAGTSLVVLNMSVQSDSSELVGGFKPVEVRGLAMPIYTSFVSLFRTTFPSDKNASFLTTMRKSFEKGLWKKLGNGFKHAIQMVRKKKQWGKTSGGRDLRAEWATFSGTVARFERQRARAETGLAFRFEEGELIHALREGRWVLLDEVNLASPETLQRLSGLLDGEKGTVALTERGDVDPVERHPGFRLLAAMNPATDVGKKDLPPALRSRFTELFVDEMLDPADLQVRAQDRRRAERWGTHV